MSLTRMQQAEFIRELMETVGTEVIDAIVGEKIPEEWDGIELRVYLTRAFEQHQGILTGRRRREFEQVLIERNL